MTTTSVSSDSRAGLSAIPRPTSWWQVGLFVLVSLSLPWVVAAFFGVPRLMLQNFTDGAFYLGYASHFRLLLEQAGIYYYMVRFPAIAPEALVLTLAGPEALLFYRYLLAGLCSLAVGGLVAARSSYFGGLLAALLWATNPFALRFVQTAYSDVAGTSFLLLGLCLICWPRVHLTAAFISGLMLAAACWSHLHAAVALFFCGPLVLLLRWEDGWQRLLLVGAVSAAGGVFLSAAAATWYFYELGMWDLVAPTREILGMLESGSVDKPFLPWIEILTQKTFWLVPLPLAVAVWFFRRDRLVLGAWLGLMGYIGFLALNDWLKEGYSLSLFYYFSFAVPTVVLTCAGILTRTAEWFARPWHGWVLLPTVVLLPPLLGATSDLSHIALLSMGFLGVLVFALGAWWKKNPAGVVIGLVFFTSILMVVAPDGRLALGRYWKSDDWPIWLASRELGRTIEAVRQPGERLRFWYDDQSGSDARMIQAFFLHEMTKWHPPAEALETPPPLYPATGPEGARSLVNAGVDWLVLLDADGARLQEAVQNLEKAGVNAEVVEAFAWGGETSWMQALLLRLPRVEVKTLPREAQAEEAWQAHHRVKRWPEQEGEVFRLRYLRGSPDLWVSLGPLSPEGWNLVEVPVEVRRGAVMVELLSDWHQPLDQNSRLVVAGSGQVRVQFRVTKPIDEALVRVRNFTPEGISTTVWVGSVEVISTQD